MAMGPVPDDDPSAIADKVDDGMATSTVYEADTQLPGPTLHGEEDETGTMPATKEADGTEPLLENDDTLAALAPAQGSHDTGGNNERERGVGGEQQERMPAATRNEAEGVADACTGEGSGEVQGEVQGEPRRVTTLPLMDTAVAVEKGVRFEEPGSAEKAEDGRGDGGSSDEDEGTVLEPPTQIMLLEIDDSNDEAEVDGTSGGARVADKVTLSIADDGAGAGDDSSAILAEGAGAAGGRESTVDLSKGEGDSASDGLDNGDETADEGDTACLFENEEDDEVSKAMGEADTTAQASAGEAGREATSISLSATPMTPSTVPEYASGRITSPGGASDVSTQRQESPGKNSTLTEGSEREEVQVPAVTLTRNGGVVEKGSEGGGEVGTTASAVGKAEGGESAVGVGQGSEGREKPVDDDDDGVDDDADDDDDASELSAALIPAQDLSGFEDDLDENVGPEEEENPLDATIPRDEGGAAADGEEGGDAVGNTVGGDSGSETDATEFDSDDGPTGHIRPESPYASPGGRGIKADPSSPARGRVSPPSRSWDIEPQPNATEKSHNEQVMSLGETRSPGGSLLRRTSTEDAMHAIAREQQRADAARCSAESARGAAAAIACDSGEDQEELKGRPEAEAEVETDKRKDLAKQALAMDANSDSDARSDDEDVIHGTMIIELEEPETALDETEVIEEEEERLDLDADGAGKRDDGREATRDGVREAAEQPTENVAQQEAHREDEVHEGDTRFRGHQTASASAVPSPAGNALHGREHSPIKGKEGVTTPPEVGDAAGYSPDNGLIGEVESAKDDDSPVKPSVDKTVGHVDDSIRDGQGELASAAAAEDATVRGAIAHGVEGGFNEARDANDGSGNEADGTWSEEETEKRGASPEREGEGQQEKREEYQTKTKEEPTGDDAGRKTSEGDRLGQALDPPAPRTSGRRRVKPRMFDEMDVEPTASNSPTPHDEAHSTDKLGSVANEAARDGKEGQGASDGEARIESDSGDGPDDPGIEAHSPPPSPVSGERDRRSDEDAGTSSDAAAGDKVVRGPSQEIVAMPDPAVEDDAKEKPDPPLRRRKRRRGGVGESPTEEEDKTEGTYGEDGDDRITLLDGGGARKRGRRTLRAAVTATPSSAENDTAQNNSPAPSEAEGRGGGRLRRGTAQAVATEKPHSSLTTDKAKGRGRKRNAAEVTCTKGEAEEEADLEDTEAATESVHKKQRGRPAVSPATSRRGQGSRRRKNGEERPESPASDPARDGVRDERETESDAVIDGNEDESVLSPPPKGNGRRGRNTKSKSASAGKPLTTAAASVPALSKRGESRPTAASAGASSVGEDEGASSSPPTSVKASRRGKATSPDPPVTSPSAVGDRSSGIAGAGGEEAEDVKVRERHPCAMEDGTWIIRGCGSTCGEKRAVSDLRAFAVKYEDDSSFERGKLNGTAVYSCFFGPNSAQRTVSPCTAEIATLFALSSLRSPSVYPLVLQSPTDPNASSVERLKVRVHGIWIRRGRNRYLCADSVAEPGLFGRSTGLLYRR